MISLSPSNSIDINNLILFLIFLKVLREKYTSYIYRFPHQYNLYSDKNASSIFLGFSLASFHMQKKIFYTFQTRDALFIENVFLKQKSVNNSFLQVSQDRTHSLHPEWEIVTPSPILSAVVFDPSLTILQASTKYFGNLTPFFSKENKLYKISPTSPWQCHFTLLVNVTHFAYQHCNGGGVRRKYWR